jgi:hypothetical protein
LAAPAHTFRLNAFEHRHDQIDQPVHLNFTEKLTELLNKLDQRERDPSPPIAFC